MLIEIKKAGTIEMKLNNQFCIRWGLVIDIINAMSVVLKGEKLLDMIKEKTLGVCKSFFFFKHHMVSICQQLKIVCFPKHDS